MKFFQNKPFFFFIFIGLLLSSCFEEEDRIPLPPTNGEIETGQAAMTNNYEYQVFYDIASNTTVSSNPFPAWDLGFATADTAWHIVLNNALTMYAGNSFSTNFEEVTTAEGLEMNFDNSGGYTDSLAINQWLDTTGETPQPTNYVYVIDLGYDEAFVHRGFVKAVFGISGNSYTVRFAGLDGENEQTVTIAKDSQLNHVCFSFDSGVVPIEPPKDSWTLLFSSYQTMLYTDEGEAVPYLVRGVLLNPYHVAAGLCPVSDFYEITIADTSEVDFSSKQDCIGYEWKYYNFEEGIYTIVPGMYYIIRNNDNFYYRFRFIDFYNEANEKGYPAFEFSRL